jgi:uncharacterized protein (DUF58 family)
MISKSILSLIAFIMLSVLTFGQTPGAKFKFVEETHDFGTIKEGDVVVYEYTFTNVGTEPLIINNCTAQCGCTVPTWSKVPIMPGAKGTISISFNSQGKAGFQQKSVYIESNAPGQDASKQKYELYFKCIVTPKQ